MSQISFFDTINSGECFITHLPIVYSGNFLNKKPGYLIEVNGVRHTIHYDFEKLLALNNNPDFIRFLTEYRHVFRGHIYNNRWFTVNESENKEIGYEELKELLNRFSYPMLPAEKKERLFVEMASLSKWDGDSIDFSYHYPNILLKCYFRNKEEMFFYIDTLVEEGLFEVIGEYSLGDVLRHRLTFKGLSELTKLSIEGANSNRCFVAMSFDQEDQYIFDAIRDACYEANKYEAFTVRDEHLESVQTINDGIIAGIKKSKFCIADFTKQKDGVYFESGYAAGRGMKVIYTCHKDYWDATHFDTKHFPHIIYENTDQLKKQLIDKIQAWID